MSDHTLSDNILYNINNSTTIEFTWCMETTTLVKHTAIVLHFDNRPQLTMDFAENSQNLSGMTKVLNRFSGISQTLSTSSIAIKAGIHVTPFSHDTKIQNLGSILMFKICDDEAKERAKKLISSILDMNIGKYNAKTNNCRHFIKKAFEILKQEPECSESNQIEFNQKMEDIEKKDQKKVKKGKLATAFTVAGTVVVTAAAVTAEILL